jgi:hypothetical protein
MRYEFCAASERTRRRFVGLAGGVVRDVLIGIPPSTFRDRRYLAVAGGAGLVTCIAHPAIRQLERPIDVLDAAGLALFCVTGAATALAHRLGVPEAIILGAITGSAGACSAMSWSAKFPPSYVGGCTQSPLWRGSDRGRRVPRRRPHTRISDHRSTGLLRDAARWAALRA